MAKMAAMLWQNLWKSSSKEPYGWWPWNLVCSLGFSGHIKFVQKDEPWLILSYFTVWSNFVWEKRRSGRLFWFYCSLWHQSWFMQSAKGTFINIKGQGHILAFALYASDSVFLTSLSLKLLGWLKLNYIWSLYGIEEWKFGLGSWPYDQDDHTPHIW